MKKQNGKIKPLRKCYLDEWYFPPNKIKHRYLVFGYLGKEIIDFNKREAGNQSLFKFYFLIWESFSEQCDTWLLKELRIFLYLFWRLKCRLNAAETDSSNSCSSWRLCFERHIWNFAVDSIYCKEIQIVIYLYIKMV